MLLDFTLFASTARNYIIFVFYFHLLGNYQETLNDATAAVTLQPTFIEAIERGKLLTIDLERLYE